MTMSEMMLTSIYVPFAMFYVKHLLRVYVSF